MSTLEQALQSLVTDLEQMKYQVKADSNDVISGNDFHVDRSGWINVNHRSIGDNVHTNPFIAITMYMNNNFTEERSHYHYRDERKIKAYLDSLIKFARQLKVSGGQLAYEPKRRGWFG